MEHEMDDQERIIRMRKMARKLAANQSKQRTIRKLPQTIQVMRPKPPKKRAIHLRSAMNTNKRLTYILLLGAVLCAYLYDIDQETLESMIQSVGHAAQDLLRNT